MIMYYDEKIKENLALSFRLLNSEIGNDHNQQRKREKL